MKELFYLSNPYLLLVLSFISLSPLYFIPVYLVLQGLGKWDTEKGKAQEGETKTKWCVYCGASQQYASVGPHGRAHWPSPWSVCTYQHTPAHTMKHAQVDLSGCRKEMAINNCCFSPRLTLSCFLKFWGKRWVCLIMALQRTKTPICKSPSTLQSFSGSLS